MIKAALLTMAIAWLSYLTSIPVYADDLPCVSTTFRFIVKNDRVCISAFDDPKVPGVACHVSQARTGGLSGKSDSPRIPLASPLLAGKWARLASTLRP